MMAVVHKILINQNIFCHIYHVVYFVLPGFHLMPLVDEVKVIILILKYAEITFCSEIRR